MIVDILAMRENMKKKSSYILEISLQYNLSQPDVIRINILASIDIRIKHDLIT